MAYFVSNIYSSNLLLFSLDELLKLSKLSLKWTEDFLSTDYMFSSGVLRLSNIINFKSGDIEFSFFSFFIKKFENLCLLVSILYGS